MSAQTDQTATVIRFPQERRRAPTLDALTDAILPETQLRSLAEIRAVTPPRQVERLRAFGRERARQIFGATPLPDTREGRQRMASDWLTLLVGRALARVSDARSLTEQAERREISQPVSAVRSAASTRETTRSTSQRLSCSTLSAATATAEAQIWSRDRGPADTVSGVASDILLLLKDFKDGRSGLKFEGFRGDGHAQCVA